MVQLPRRSRSHRVDSEGRRALEEALPEAFMVRHAEQPEYGIDGEVEVFDLADDSTTGLRFYFQLKSTDEFDLRQALRVRLKTTTVNYFRSASMPVVIALYHAPTKSVYVRWFHHYDPYYEGTATRGGAPQTITFHIHPSDLLDEARGLSLAGEAQAWLDIRGRAVPQPLPIVVQSSRDDVSTTQLRLALQDVTSRLRAFVSVEASNDSTMIATIAVGNSGVQVWIAGTTSLTLHQDLGDRGSRQLAVDLCFALAMALLHASIDAPAIRIAVQTAAQSRLSSHPEFIFFLASAIKGTNRFGDGLAIAAAFAEIGGDKRPLAQIMLLPLMGNETSLAAGEIAEAKRIYDVLVEGARSERDAQAEASALYSSAKFRMALQDPASSIEFFNMAKVADPSYANRAYYWGDLAGALFLSEEFSASVDAYEKARSLDSSSRLVALHADALMSAGRLRESRRLFEGLLTEDPSVHGSAEWRLKLRFMKILQDELGYGDVVVGFSMFSAGMDDALSASNDVRDVADRLHRLLDCEPLNTHVLVNLAVSYRKAGLNPEARELFLGAALLCTGDLDAWLDALLITLTDKECQELDTDEVRDSLLQAAAQAQGTALTTGLAGRLSAATGDRDRLLDLVSEYVSSYWVDKGPMLMRFGQEDGEQLEVEVERLIG